MIGETLQQLGLITGVVVGTISGVIYIFRAIRSTNRQMDSETIKTYQDSVDSLEKRLDLLEKENKELHAQINQLIGENKALKDTLNLRDPDLIKRLTKALEANEKVLVCIHDHDLRTQKLYEFCETEVKPALAIIRRQK